MTWNLIGLKSEKVVIVNLTLLYIAIPWRLPDECRFYYVNVKILMDVTESPISVSIVGIQGLAEHILSPTSNGKGVGRTSPIGL